jgi:hypothetical protein
MGPLQPALALLAYSVWVGCWIRSGALLVQFDSERKREASEKRGRGNGPVSVRIDGMVSMLNHC